MRYLTIIWIFIFFSCNNNREIIQKCTSNTKYNTIEITEFLTHYKNNESFKNIYIKFILANISTHYSPDTTNYSTYLQFLKIADSITNLNYPEDSLKASINPLWDKFNNKNLINRRRFSQKVNDLNILTLDDIIENIDVKYNMWKKNKFTQNQPEKIFLNYILPYRVIDNIMPDDYFVKISSDNLSIINNVPTTNIMVAIDSLLVKYKNIIYSVDVLPLFPYLTTASIINSKRIRCEERVWFNYYLLSSVGIPTAIDFVPNWGNRNASHTWNVIVTKDSIIPFEPFYSTDRWEYKYIYNNEAEDGFVKWWGKFRLPKVYRYTYSILNNELIKDDNVNAEDIPPLFRTDKIVDVSSEYFKTVDVILHLSKQRPEGVSYAFLCVQNRMNWVPVQYSKIRNNKTKFKDMGMDIVYLPAYYKNGEIIPAGDPFYLSKDGEITKIVDNTTKKTSLKLVRRYPLNEKKFISHNKLVNSYFLLAKTSDFSDSIMPYKIPIIPQMKPYISSINTKMKQYRYIRFVYDQDAYLSELKVVINNNQKKDTLLFDSNYIELNYKHRAYLQNKYIDIDLGNDYLITDLEFCGLDDKFCIIAGKSYELFYWDDKWISAGKQVATTDYLVFNEVPGNKLYYLDCSDNDAFKRSFVYKNENQLFW